MSVSNGQWTSGPPGPPQGGQVPPAGWQPAPPPQQSFGWGPSQPPYVQYGAPPNPQGPPGQWGPPPRRRAGRGLVIGLSIVGVAAVAILAIAALRVLHSNTPTYAPVVPTTAGWSPSPVATQPTVTRTSVLPTTRTVRTTSPATTASPTSPSDQQILIHSRLYSTGVMPSVRCRESPARPTSRSGAIAYYVHLIPCLNAAWAPIVRKAGARFRPPTVLAFAGQMTSPCGSGPPGVSFYCGSNQVIYMKYDADVQWYRQRPDVYNHTSARMWSTFTVAHEYGHHVQNLTGILSAYYNLRYQTDYVRGLELNRRMELQASCFSGVFVGANRATYPVTGTAYKMWLWDVSNTRDPRRDHGDSASHSYWSRRAFAARSPGACTLFSAPSRLVA